MAQQQQQQQCCSAPGSHRCGLTMELTFLYYTGILSKSSALLKLVQTGTTLLLSAIDPLLLYEIKKTKQMLHAKDEDKQKAQAV